MSVDLDFTVKLAVDNGTLPRIFNGWRYLHKVEGGNQQNPWNMPEVGPPLNAGVVSMTQEIQWMSYDLMFHFNRNVITPQIWTTVHRHDKAFNNFNGFEKSGDPRRNFILDTNRGYPLPRYDKAQRVSGGQFLRGTVRGDKLVCVPGVHGIDATKPLPSIQTIVDNNWYVLAVTLYGETNPVGHFPQGKGGPVAIPFILSKEVEYPLSWFERWQRESLPDVLRFYK